MMNWLTRVPTAIKAAYRAMAGGIEAGKSSRLHDYWRPANRSPDAWFSDGGKMTRARARDLVQNNSYAKGIVRAKVRNVVGKGYGPQARTENDTFNTASEKLFKKWKRHADVTGRLSFYEMQRLVLAEVETAGEILVHRVEVEDSLSPVPFKLELIDTDRLADEYFFRDRLQTEDGNEVRLGIEYDANGRPVAYHITEEHPNGLSLFRSIPKRIPAKDILHLYITERAGQGRGLSQFAPNVWWLKNLDRYVENEVVASAIASAISVVIKTMDGGAGGNTSLGDSLNGDTVSDQGNRFNFFEPGGVSQLLSSEEIEPFNNARGHSESAVFLNTMLRSMAVGAGLSFERLSRDYSQTNFSSNRASDLEDRKEFRILQQWLDFHFNEPVYQWLVEAGVRVGFEDFPTPSGYLADRDYWSEHEWQNPGWEWVDPRNEAQAADKGLRNGTINLVDYLAAQGINWEEHLDKIQKVQESLEQRGITLGMTEQIDLEDDIDADS